MYSDLRIHAFSNNVNFNMTDLNQVSLSCMFKTYTSISTRFFNWRINILFGCSIILLFLVCILFLFSFLANFFFFCLFLSLQSFFLLCQINIIFLYAYRQNGVQLYMHLHLLYFAQFYCSYYGKDQDLAFLCLCTLQRA